ncbi:hypothetical protein BD0130_05480 [Helicobacter pylori]
MSGAHIVENTNNEKIENTNISKTTASRVTPNDKRNTKEMKHNHTNFYKT